MEFGVFDHINRNQLPLRDAYEARLKIVESYDRNGFHAYHFAEHHFTPIGIVPSPSVFMGAISQRTKRLRFGPFLFAEERTDLFAHRWFGRKQDSGRNQKEQATRKFHG